MLYGYLLYIYYTSFDIRCQWCLREASESFWELWEKLRINWVEPKVLKSIDSITILLSVYGILMALRSNWYSIEESIHSIDSFDYGSEAAFLIFVLSLSRSRYLQSPWQFAIDRSKAIDQTNQILSERYVIQLGVSITLSDLFCSVESRYSAQFAHQY